MPMENNNWFKLNDTEAVISPALLVYPERIQHNIRKMIAMAGGPEKLRPHIKTHKTAEIVQMQLELGIQKFKCATIAEAELLALCKAPDILLAMQPVGANIERFFRLMTTYPDSKFSALVDNLETLNSIADLAKTKSTIISLWMDIDTGMQRTGIRPNEKAAELFNQMASDPNIEARGLHAYDGHIRNTDVDQRKTNCDNTFKSVLELRESITSKGIEVKDIVAGGSPTFPFHCKREGVEASPGTTLLWDAGYGGLFPEMEFLPAAILITRIISKPGENRLCLDLGHKHLAPEMPFPRVQFFGMEDCVQKGHSEEHLVLECENPEAYNMGNLCYAIPIHICPTVAKYEILQIVSEGEITGSWKVAARNQSITI